MCPEGGSNGNVLGVSYIRCVQRGFNGNVLRGYPTSGCVQRGFNGNYREVCPEGVQNKCPGGGGGGGYGVEALCPGGIP